MLSAKTTLILLVLFLLFGINAISFAQTASSKTQVDTTKYKVTEEEILLDEILIEGVIEKPNVSILPTRKESIFKEIDFIDRTFEKELKNGPEKLLMLDIDFDRVKKIKNLDEILMKVKKIDDTGH